MVRRADPRTVVFMVLVALAALIVITVGFLLSGDPGGAR